MFFISFFLSFYFILYELFRLFMYPFFLLLLASVHNINFHPFVLYLSAEKSVAIFLIIYKYVHSLCTSSLSRSIKNNHAIFDVYKLEIIFLHLFIFLCMFACLQVFMLLSLKAHSLCQSKKINIPKTKSPGRSAITDID